MIDISDKAVVRRTATAKGTLRLRPATITAIKARTIKKGDALTVAMVAGITAVKSTPVLIPMCHQIPITSAAIDFEVSDTHIICTCKVSAYYKTGVEMEALTGLCMALLTLWDMVKYLEKDEHGQYPETRILDVEVVEKTKNGKCGGPIDR